MDSVNEWAELTTAVDILKDYKNQPNDGSGSWNIVDFADPIIESVPRLLDAYAELWETSGAMMQAWEQLAEAQLSTIKPATMDEIRKFTT